MNDPLTNPLPFANLVSSEGNCVEVNRTPGTSSVDLMDVVQKLSEDNLGNTQLDLLNARLRALEIERDCLEVNAKRYSKLKTFGALSFLGNSSEEIDHAVDSLTERRARKL